MPLCEICKAIPFEDLPPFPEEQYFTNLTGLKYVQILVRHKVDQQHGDDARVRHHASIDELRNAAAGGCELCVLIQGGVDLILAELESLEDQMNEYFDEPPTFNMWLTKRPDGGQGFWVLSECSSRVRGMAIVPVAAFSFTVGEDDALAGTFRGRPVEQNPDIQTLQRLARWNTECEQHHDCYQSTGRIPSHLIDVQSSKSDDTVKLVRVDAKCCHRYTALTYTSESGILPYWESNILPEDGEIYVTSLPKMFQDAVLVTRTLGYRFVWIDALCIPGSLRDWARDSVQAGTVYENSHLTISATGSKSLDDGLLFARSPRTCLRIPYRTRENVTGIVLLSTLPHLKEVNRSQYIEMMNEPISNGVWSFQERVLSSRIVHFASDQIYFECLRHFVSEDGLLERMRYHTTVKNLPEAGAHYRKRSIKESSLSRWYSILWDYGQRQPSTSSDKLIALSNVARAFHYIIDDEYVAGFWKKSLIESLCWQSLHCRSSGESSAPSWSWASVNGIPCVGFGGKSTHSIATIINTQVTLMEESKPFGRVTAASIELNAPLIPLKLSKKEGLTGHIYVHTFTGDERGFYAGFDTIERRYEVSAASLQDVKLFALILAETHKAECLTRDCNIEGSYNGVIVTPVDTSELRVKRLGFLVASPLSLGSGELSQSRKTITLV